MQAMDLPLPEDVIAALAEALWAKMIGSNCDPVDLNLRAKLALERHLLGGNNVPFGLDKLGTSETAAYIGVQPETLRDKVKRRHLGLPAQYAFARKLFWRRSELDAWIETQRPANESPSLKTHNDSDPTPPMEAGTLHSFRRPKRRREGAA
jgi:hypothetical protein